ncbi:MAG TPA: aldo/keto reductase [Euzebyales bacterium]|nr:aldo/keto reductase [Euzebyales bacterium]
MEQRDLGQGVATSRLALGTMTFGAESDEATAYQILDAFVAAGGTLIDTADVYSDGTAERWVGRWLRRHPDLRDELVVVTKGRFPVTGQPGAGLSRVYLRTALEASLRRLDVDHVDVYLAHGPDHATSLEELAAFFAEAVATGRARHVGVSNLVGWQIAKLAALLERQGGPRLVTHQPQYNLLAREVEWEVLPAAHDAGISAIAWGPLAAGWLTGKYRRNAPPPEGSRLGDDPTRGIEAWDRRGTERTWTIIDRVSAVAAELGVSPAVAALAWVADRPGVAAAIVGARTAEQLHATLPAASLHLPDDATAVLDDISTPPAPDYPYRFADEHATVTS